MHSNQIKTNKNETIERERESERATKNSNIHEEKINQIQCA